jgi:hypothetical protein
MAANEPVQKYYDALIASYDILTSAISKANDRGLKVTRQFATDVATGQREALELGRKLAAEPTDMGKYYSALLEATTAAQGRALAFTQAAYQDAVTAGSDARETVEKLVEANRETAEAAVQVAKTWTAANPVADMMRKGMENFQAAATDTKKKAAKASA